MRRKTRKTLKFTAEHAVRALHFLISDGKIAARDVATALKRRERQIKELRNRLAALEGSVEAKLTNFRRRGTQRGRKPKSRISRAQRVARQAQGRYMSAVRMLSKANRAKVKAIRAKSGVRAAIAGARKLARG